LDLITENVRESIEKGPIADIREQYTPRAFLEKEILKVQNAQRKLAEE